MITKLDLEALQAEILNNIDLSNSHLSPEYYYSSIVFCVIDSIFSINSNYNITKKVVERTANKIGVDLHRTPTQSIENYRDSITVSNFLNKIEHLTYDQLAADFFENRQRTSTANGILKAQAVVEFLNVLESFDVERLSDVRKMKGNLLIENKIENIKGQKSCKSLNYFYMLSGDENLIKADRHIIGFVERALNKSVSAEDAEKLLIAVANNLKEKNANITPRVLDHEIWKMMSLK